MVSLLTLASAVALGLIWNRQRNALQRSGLEHVFLKSVRGFLLPFFFVGIFYTGLQLWVDHQTDRISTTTTVRELEETLERIRLELLAPFELSPWVRLGIVLALIALGMLVPRLERARLPRAFRIGSEAISRVYFVVALFGSFTFLGSDLYGAIEARQVHIKEHMESIGRAYADLYSEAETLSEDLIVRQVLEQPHFSQVSREEWEAWETAQESHRRLEEVRSRQDVQDARLASLTSELRFPSEPSREAVDEIGRTARARRAESFLAGRDRGSWSQKGAEDAKAALDEVQKRFGVESNPRLHEILRSTIELVYSGVGEAVVSSVFGAFGLKADLLLVQLFFERTLHEPVQDLLTDSAEKIFNASTRHPETLEGAADEVRERASGLRFDPNRLSEAQSFAAREKRIFQEVGSSAVAAMHAADVQTLERGLTASVNLPNPILSAAAFRLAAAAQASAQSSPETASRLVALVVGEPSDTSDRIRRLLAVEEALGREELTLALDLATEEAIASDRSSRWGRYRVLAERNWDLAGTMDVREAFRRQQATDEPGIDLNLLHPPEVAIQAEMKETIRDWMRWQKRVAALHAVSERWNESISPGAWENAFFHYTQKNERAAVVWAWLVKDLNSPLLEARYGRAIPEYGYSYYAEENGFLERSGVREFFSRPTVTQHIERYCK